MKQKLDNSTISPRSDESAAGGQPSSFVTRMAKVLVCLSDGINTVTDISNACGLSTSTTHRLLNTLKEPLLTIYEPETHRYYLGPLITRLASKPRSTHQYLIICALNEMKRLAQITEETISLDLIVGIQFIHAYDIPSIHSLKVLEQTTEIQPVIPLGAAQKVLLSQIDEKSLKLALKSAKKWTTGTQVVTDLETIDLQLNQIRRQGYSITRSEAIPGALGISTPVKNYFCPVSLTILGPENRLEHRVPELTGELLASTNTLSNDIAEFFK
jgi:DNA-binding IclR family transcriptional regulator